jgi:hypothetical protein
MMLLDAHVGPGKEGSGKTHERGQRDQKHVEGVDEELLMRDQHGAVADNPQHQERGSDERCQAHPDIKLGGEAAGAEEGQRKCPQQRQAQNQQYFHFSPP